MSDTRRTIDRPDIDRKALMHALWDGVGERFIPRTEGHWDWYKENVEKPVAAILCHVYGHDAIRDQCGNPEHDHCAWCMSPMPHAASEEQPVVVPSGPGVLPQCSKCGVRGVCDCTRQPTSDRRYAVAKTLDNLFDVNPTDDEVRAVIAASKQPTQGGGEA